MQLKGIHHVSINVRDVDAALQFYVDVLGMEPLVRPSLGFPGAWLRSGQQEVHLLGVDSGAPLKEQHFAFLVDELETVIAELKGAGALVGEVNEMQGICRQVFTHDPSGNLVEFNQRL